MTVQIGFRSLPLPIVQLSLAAVLKCGQSFRWHTFSLQDPDSRVSSDSKVPLVTIAVQPTHEYRLCLRDRVICLRQSSDTLYYRDVFPDPQPTGAHLASRHQETLTWLKDYFQLDIDLVALYEQWAAQDNVFATFQDRFCGIRVLRQDPWENLASFICSANNNIARITKMVSSLCKEYSPPLLSLPDPNNPTEYKTYHPFPPPSVLVPEEVGLNLRTLGFGYRAEYIQRTAKMLVDEHGKNLVDSEGTESSEIWLKGLRKKSTAEARQALRRFIGVGPKVADCVLLMSLDKNEVVPVDTHVYQIAIKHYGLKGSVRAKTSMSPKLYDEINAKFYVIWGQYAGWAHTVLFTADLKSFSSYGLATPPSSSVPISAQKRSKLISPVLQVPQSKTPLKRQYSDGSFGPKYQALEDTILGLEKMEVDEVPDSQSLAERVKKRRRLVTT